ncbi:MAG: prepilin-type N-terminal cleavage/methylation domain-containing protein [Actinobacteria bacterium]|nr:prepilin-type N-terminal cleavage/methylation domain-containing protein [Actinomycetota bacterium]
MNLYLAERRAFLRSGERGFTLIELLVAMSIMSVLFTLGALAIRQFWFVRALSGSQDQIATQLRQIQQRVVAETHPLVYGARFHVGDKTMSLVRFDPETNTCRQYQTVELGTGVEIAVGTDVTSDSTEPHIFCSANLTLPGGGAVSNRSTSEYVFFFARGNGTPGTITIRSTPLDRTESVQIAGITGRVIEG